MPPETGASTIVDSRRRRASPIVARAVATSIVEQSIRMRAGSAPCRSRVVSIDVADVLAGGEHGDDGLGVLAPPRRPRRRGVQPRPRRGERVLDRSKARTSCPALARFGGHAAAHVAEPDECDACHVYS